MTPGDRLNLQTAVGYIDAQYDEYITNIAGVPTDVADYREVQNTPKWTASGTLSYTTPVGDGSLYAGTTVSWRSKTYQFEIPNPYIDQKGYALWDASIVYTAPDDRWSIGLHGKNILDKEYKTSGYTFVAADPVTGAIVIPALVFLVPIHIGVLGAVLAIMTLMGVTNHMGWELFPHALVRSRAGGALITASHHQLHHDRSSCNYGLYFRFWDRLCGTDRGLAAEGWDVR